MLANTMIEQFGNTLRGTAILPGDPAYDEARAVWNGMIDRRPALIVRCNGAADVRAAVNFAREQDLPITVKAGGHNVAGKAVCDDGLVVDLSQMNSVQVNPDTQTARVAAGATWGDFDSEAQSFGLATTGGVDSRTGVAGLTLGGGIGYLARKHGLAIDNLLAVDIVTADGELRRASEKRNADLFWALRGGGGGVGVVTSFEFQLHELGPDVLVAQNYLPFADAHSALQFYRDLMADAPDELACYAMILRVPPVEPFPAKRHGEITVALIACYTGPMADGEGALAPIRSFGDPILSFVQPMPYTVLQSSFDAGTPDGERYYYKSQYFADLQDDAIDAIVDQIEPLPGAYTIVGLEPLGGEIARVEPTETVFANRDAAFNFSIWAGWSDPGDDERVIGWTRAIHEALMPYSTGGAYLNYLDRDDELRLTDAYRDNYERLDQIRNAWDPEGVFQKR
ncbi:MAG: FAD-binding oxidoreductase [Candidatus Promineifilaceae bacterium]|nr:FAD-binding oxidoreductase [Candidatus Promineifilaceae bacterium]